MITFAQVINGVVQQVIVAEQSFINTGAVGNPHDWIQNSDGNGNPLHKNYAGGGYHFDAARNAFIAPQPFPSWILDEVTCQWNSPIPMPASCMYCFWNEDAKAWTDAADPQMIEAAQIANEVLDA